MKLRSSSSGSNRHLEMKGKHLGLNLPKTEELVFSVSLSVLHHAQIFMNRPHKGNQDLVIITAV